METRKYKCNYCKKKYIPKKRGRQKYCSNSCRVRNHQLKNKIEGKNLALPENKRNSIEKTKINQMSIAGVGNALVGTAIVEGVKNVFTIDGEKAATKNDIKKLENKFQRFHIILNQPKNHLGFTPYYDMIKRKVVYLIS